jgi:hypothetical protein
LKCGRRSPHYWVMKNEATARQAKRTAIGPVEFERFANGHFAVFLNGEKTEWQIINGCLGSSGYGRNLYGITRPDETANQGVFVRWVGSLAAAKKVMAYTLTKGGR